MVEVIDCKLSRAGIAHLYVTGNEYPLLLNDKWALEKTGTNSGGYRKLVTGSCLPFTKPMTNMYSGGQDSTDGLNLAA